MEPVFDTPQWKFRIPPEGTEDSIEIGVVECFSLEDPEADSEFRGVAKVVLPSELFKYAKDVLKVTDINTLSLYLEQVNKRWYLITQVSDEKELDLWYYTIGNLPVWARRVYGN